MDWELPFTRDAFFQVFADYNKAIWPIPVVAYLIGVIAFAATLVKDPVAGRIVLFLLAALWAFTGIVYQGSYFSTINPAAKLFAIGFVAQAALLLGCAVWGRYEPSSKDRLWAWGLAIFSLVFYPALGAAFGHVFPAAPTFGVTPCPLVIFTFAMLVGLERAPAILFVAPVLWAAVGGIAAIKLGVAQDWALPLSAAVALWRRARPLVARQ